MKKEFISIDNAENIGDFSCFVKFEIDKDGNRIINKVLFKPKLFFKGNLKTDGWKIADGLSNP